MCQTILASVRQMSCHVMLKLLLQNRVVFAGVFYLFKCLNNLLSFFKDVHCKVLE